MTKRASEQERLRIAAHLSELRGRVAEINRLLGVPTIGPLSEAGLRESRADVLAEIARLEGAGY